MLENNSSKNNLNNNKNIAVFVVPIFVFLSFLIIGFILYKVGFISLKTNNSNSFKSQQISPVIPKPETENQNINTTSLQGNIYTNPKFGFQLTIPSGMTDYKIIATSSNKGLPVITFYFPPANIPGEQCIPNLGYVDPDTHKCYGNTFTISAITQSDYDKIIKDCSINNNPMCPAEGAKYIKVNGYVYNIDHSQSFVGIYYDKNYIEEIFNSLKPF